MNFFNYLYFRMYKAYLDKNDSPISRTFMYMTFFIYCIIAIVSIFVEKIILKLNLQIDTNFVENHYTWIFLFVIDCVSVYLLFSIKNFCYYEDKFLNCHKINKIVKLWMLIILPFFFFFFSLYIYGLLFGAEFLGKPYGGLWE